jgi:hypothetical protein
MTAGKSAPERRPAGRAQLSPAAGCGLSLAIGLAGTCLVAAILALAFRGEIVLGRGIGNESRLWLVREEGQTGLGLSLVQATASPKPGVACERTSVYFIVWGAGDPKPAVAYCDCYQLMPGAIVYEGACAP